MRSGDPGRGESCHDNNPSVAAGMLTPADGGHQPVSDRHTIRKERTSMILRSRPRAWTLALGLAVLGWAAGSAQAAPITYATVGSVDTPPGGLPGLVYYNGISHGTVTPPDSIDL